jgi:hypothetical protein
VVTHVALCQVAHVLLICTYPRQLCMVLLQGLSAWLSAQAASPNPAAHELYVARTASALCHVCIRTAHCNHLTVSSRATLYPAGCPPGTGTSNTSLDEPGTLPTTSDASCRPCASGFFGPAGRSNGNTACYACPLHTTHIFFYGGDVNSLQPAPVSQPGAQWVGACMPEFTSVQEPNWWLPASSGMVNASAAVARNMSNAEALEACLEACRQAGAGLPVHELRIQQQELPAAGGGGSARHKVRAWCSALC